MRLQSFPDDPSRRRVVLVLTQHDIEKSAYENGAARALQDEETYVVQFPVAASDDQPLALRNITDSGLATPGRMLVQSPYDPNTYEDASLAAKRFAMDKHMHFSMLCQHLGAKEVLVKQIELKTQTGKSKLDLTAERHGVSAEVGITNEDLDSLRNELSLRQEFHGGSANIDAAEQLLRRTSLLADPGMKTLLELRRDGDNPLKTHEISLSLSSESRKRLEVAARLKIPQFVRLTADYQRVCEEQHEYKLTVVVRF